MKTTFYIDLSFRTPKGPECFARFFIGNNRKEAYELFQQLQGTDNVDDNNILFIDLMETVAGLPFNLKMKTCTLSELGENCKLITKDVFRLYTIKK